MSNLVRYGTSAEKGGRLGAVVAVGVGLFAAYGEIMPQVPDVRHRRPPLAAVDGEFHVYLREETLLFQLPPNLHSYRVTAVTVLSPRIFRHRKLYHLDGTDHSE